MLLSLNWLKDYVKIPNEITPQDLAAKMTMHTVEVDGVHSQGEQYRDIIVGRILNVSAHQNADKLRVASVDIGSSTVEIVCGADNIKAGQMVPTALPGAKLPGGFEIREAEIRGVKSAGMLCAEDEIGFGSDHSGIMILGKRARKGQLLSEYLKLDDTIIEVDNKSITHRPDLWSHVGMAREISAFLKTRLTSKAKDMLDAKISDSDTLKNVIDLDCRVENTQLCKRYMAVAIGGIRIADSPEWISRRLIAAGMRPINNIVDITNYVMLELGQPLHAFSASKIMREEDGIRKIDIVVRNAVDGEKLETLDAKIRELSKNMLIIADQAKPIAVAGVMGGAGCEVDEVTEEIVLESANFDFVSIRKTAQALGLRTEASMRFEKGLDPYLCETALMRMIGLIKQSCPQSEIISKTVDIRNFSQEQRTIVVPLEYVRKRLGFSIERKEAVKILERIGFVVTSEKGGLRIDVPSWRAGRDIALQEDIIEEIARLYGYDNIIRSLPTAEIESRSRSADIVTKRKIKHALAGAGLTETSNYSFVGEDQLKKLNIQTGDHLRLLNPIASHLTLMRKSLVPNLFQAVVKNQARFSKIELFEFGSVYMPATGEMPAGNDSISRLPFQEERAGLILASSEPVENLLLRLKGIIGYLANIFGASAEYLPSEAAQPWTESEKLHGNVKISGIDVGTISAFDKKIASTAGAKKNVVVAELSLKDLARALLSTRGTFSEFERFPPAVRDLAIVVDQKISYYEIRQEILDFSEVINQAHLFDVYQGDKIGAKNKSLAFNLVYQTDKTMTSEEVDAIQKDLIRSLEEKFGAKLRDF